MKDNYSKWITWGYKVSVTYMSNQVENWINSDEKLQGLVMEIESTGKSHTRMAEMAFEKLCILYNIPRMPADVIENAEEEFEDSLDDLIENRSLFEEHALIKYLSDEDTDPRGMVLSAAWNLLNDFRVDLWKVAQKEFGNNIPYRCQIGLR